MNEQNSFCEPIGCDSTSCPAVFNQPPASFPVPGDTAPTQPLFQCPSDASGYRIVYVNLIIWRYDSDWNVWILTCRFCPERTFPPPRDSLSIHPSSNINKCIDVRGGQFTNGTNVQMYVLSLNVSIFLRHRLNANVRVAFRCILSF